MIRVERRGEAFVVRTDAGTEHVVTVPDEMLADPVLGHDPEGLIRESFGFLLEREPASSILTRFSLDVIARYFPEYPDEIRRRLETRPP